MKAEDYDAFLEDPEDRGIRKLWPRLFTELEGPAMLPPRQGVGRCHEGMRRLPLELEYRVAYFPPLKLWTRRETLSAMAGSCVTVRL